MNHKLLLLAGTHVATQRRSVEGLRDPLCFPHPVRAAHLTDLDSGKIVSNAPIVDA